MSAFPTIPLSLYIHIPWCVKKCPYCDFNSYPKDKNCAFSAHETAYVDALLLDLRQELYMLELTRCNVRHNLQSIFIGGGTPSLFSLSSIAKILSKAASEFVFDKDIEITMEVNPGTIDYQYLVGLHELGVNRLSIGVQSLQDDKLRVIGRIHDAKSALQAVDFARRAGFANVNLDLIFGLPQQSIKDAVSDLRNAISLAPTHISWYQLAIEVGSEFYRNSPLLPSMDEIWEIQRVGQEYLVQHDYVQYEVSAYSSRPGYQCQHNLNYWFFGDYIGIGAGAHGKITCNNAENRGLSKMLPAASALKISRNCKFSSPEQYLQGVASGKFIAENEVIAAAQLPFEFMLNALRLYRPIPFALFTQRTGLDISVIADQLRVAEERGLIKIVDSNVVTTEQGRNFLNDLLEIFI